MRSFITPCVLAASLAMLSACGGSTEDNAVTETRMDDLDSLEGTISDDMINTDESTDEAPVEAAPAETAPTGKQDSTERPEKAQSKETGGPDIAKIDTASEPK
jgi:hypothetical protein